MGATLNGYFEARLVKLRYLMLVFLSTLESQQECKLYPGGRRQQKAVQKVFGTMESGSRNCARNIFILIADEKHSEKWLQVAMVLLLLRRHKRNGREAEK